MEIVFHSHIDSNTVIATKFCTWHDSCAVVACAKICRDRMASNGITARRSFHRIWIAGKKPLVKRAPVFYIYNGHAVSNAGSYQIAIQRHTWVIKALWRSYGSLSHTIIDAEIICSVLKVVVYFTHDLPWAFYQIRKIAGYACAGNAGNISPIDFKGNR